MTRPRVILCNCAHGNPHTSRNFRRELDATVVEFDATTGDLPSVPDADGVVITGSRSSVYWDEPWIEAVKDWTRDVLERDVPVLGVCWGHQLLADVLGGTVTDMGEYEVGYSEITHTGTSSLFEGIDRRFLSFTSHSDAVETLPPGAVATAENEHSNHGFELGSVYGIQFHPEYDREAARALIEEKDLDPDRRQALLDSLTRQNHRRSRQSATVFENFLEEVRASPAAAAD